MHCAESALGVFARIVQLAGDLGQLLATECGRIRRGVRAELFAGAGTATARRGDAGVAWNAHGRSWRAIMRANSVRHSLLAVGMAGLQLHLQARHQLPVAIPGPDPVATIAALDHIQSQYLIDRLPLLLTFGVQHA
jgi:hypothetical protein